MKFYEAFVSELDKASMMREAVVAHNVTLPPKGHPGEPGAEFAQAQRHRALVGPKGLAKKVHDATPAEHRITFGAPRGEAPVMSSANSLIHRPERGY